MNLFDRPSTQSLYSDRGFDVDCEKECWKVDVVVDIFEVALGARQTILFVNTQDDLHAVAPGLAKAEIAAQCVGPTIQPYPQWQDDADGPLTKFRRGELRLLVVHDDGFWWDGTADLGLMPSLVLNYSEPPTEEAYFRRSARGRFGRGLTITLVVSGKPLLAKVETRYGCPIEDLPMDFDKLIP